MSGWKVWTVIVSMLCSVQFTLAQQAAETILYNGKVLTVDRNFAIAEAVAVRGDKIAAVGKSDEVLKLAGPNTIKVDLKGRTVVPGLINTHQHMESPGGYVDTLPVSKRKTYPVNFKAVKTKDDVLKQIKDTIAAFKIKPGEWIYFTSNPRGDQAGLLFDDLNRWELDKVTPNNPIAIDMGIPVVNGFLVNSKAIEALWAKYGNFIETYGRYWLDASGKPDGHLEPPAVRLLLADEAFLPWPAPEDVAPLYRKVLEEDSALGLTTFSGALHLPVVRVYQWLDARGEMPLRYGYGVMQAFDIPGTDMKPYKMGAGTDMIWITSMSPRAVDGAGSRMCTALKRDSQAVATAKGQEATMMGLSAISGWWPRGQCSLDIEYNGGTRGARIKGNYFLEFYNKVAQNGLRSANFHMSGDDSHSRLISEWERIDRAKPGAVKGWAMDHCSLINPKDIPRAAKLGLMWSCPPLGEGGYEGLVGEDALAFGEQVANTYVAPIKSMLDAGINVSIDGFGWLGVETLITRKDKNGKLWGPDQRVDRPTALRISTQNGANYVLKGDKLGSIEPGKFADLVVIDRDYMTIPEEDISETRSLMTMVGGKFIFVNTGFANEYNLKPSGAVISTYEELVKRRPVGGFGGGG